MANLTSEYTRKYTSFSGSDIVATFNGKVVGELQQISYSVTREKVPIYTMGSADPRSFSRGKRGVAGSLVFTTFDRDVFADFIEDGENNIGTIHTNEANLNYSKSGRAKDGILFYNLSTEDWESILESSYNSSGDGFGDYCTTSNYRYSDEILPFDVTITMQNEYGQSACMSILGVEILNEGSGYGIDDITTSKACTFIARRVTPLTKGTKPSYNDGATIKSKATLE